MGGGHDHRRAGFLSGSGAEELGAEQVGVEEVDLPAAEVRNQLADGGLVVLGWEHRDADAQLTEALDRAAIGQEGGLDLESGSVQVEEQRNDAFLGPTRLAGRQQLKDPRLVHQ
jgi:hypothetical protein